MADASLIGGPFIIERLGAQGDGVASGGKGPVFVPFALPGETFQRAADGAAAETDYIRLTDSADRVAPPCRHFQACGGCVAQHMSDALYSEWKTGLVTQALAHQGIDIEMSPLWRAPIGSRRRVVLSAANIDAPDGRRIVVGFRAAGTHDLVEISECVIADAKIVEALPGVRRILKVIATGNGAVGDALADDTRVHVLRADNGVDVVVEGVRRPLGAPERQKLADLAQQHGILRLNAGGEEIFQSEQPVLRIGEAAIRVPGGVFVQAVAAAEGEMARMVVKALSRAKHVADLFCGLGTFSLPLAKRARVLAVDNQPEAVAALGEAVRHAQGLKPIESLRRDLFREPLSRGELNAFDGIVFDPPRAGAAAQAETIAKSTVPTVVAVSCNPATLARDLRCLIDGGYRLESVTPLDQFVFSAHVEAVAVLKR